MSNTNPHVELARMALAAPAYVDKHAAAGLTSLSERKLDYARSVGDLPSYKVGKRVLFRVADLDVWLSRFRVDVTSAALSEGRPQ